MAGVAGVALGDIDHHFAWQAWHFVAGVALMALDWLRWHVWAGMALGNIDRHFAWQAWHLVTATLRGRRGTWRHLLSLCVARVALMALHWLRRGRRGTW